MSSFFNLKSLQAHEASDIPGVTTFAHQERLIF